MTTLLAAIDFGPDVDAFTTGVQVGLAAVLIVLAVVGALAAFRRIVEA